MVGTETLRFLPEQQQAYQRISGFFGRAEAEYPAAAKQLVGVVGGLVGDQQTTERKLQDGMGNIDVGLALIGDWLKETGADGFEVKLGLGGGTKKVIGRRQVKFPTASDLIRVRGSVSPDLQKQMPPLLASFSRQVKGGLDVGLAPRQIVGGLVAESVGSRLSVNGSTTLRSALGKPLDGHFEWIREALKIPDAAEQPGFTAKAAPAVEQKKPVEVDLTSAEKVFVDILEGLVGMEKSTGTFEARELQQFEARELHKYFQDMRSYFSKLPSGGRLRAETMRFAAEQLGEKEKDLRKARKTDGEIFDEWLKQVFIPLYRRAGKPK